MDQKMRGLLLAPLRLTFLALGFVIGGLYKLACPNREVKLARQNEENLARDIQYTLPFIFSQMEGRIVPNEGVEFPPPFDYAIITVDCKDVRMRFTRGRDQLVVQLAPKSSPNSWHELSTVLSVLGIPGVQRGSISTLNQAGELMRQHSNDITSALSETEYPDVKKRLMEVYQRDRIITKQLEIEINRNLYG